MGLVGLFRPFPQRFMQPRSSFLIFGSMTQSRGCSTWRRGFHLREITGDDVKCNHVVASPGGLGVATARCICRMRPKKRCHHPVWFVWAPSLMSIRHICASCFCAYTSIRWRVPLYEALRGRKASAAGDRPAEGLRAFAGAKTALAALLEHPLKPPPHYCAPTEQWVHHAERRCSTINRALLAIGYRPPHPQMQCCWLFLFMYLFANAGLRGRCASHQTRCWGRRRVRCLYMALIWLCAGWMLSKPDCTKPAASNHAPPKLDRRAFQPPDPEGYSSHITRSTYRGHRLVPTITMLVGRV